MAEWADGPCERAGSPCPHLWLVTTGAERVERLTTDPDYYDAKVAGWWVWGICQWIGSGWCHAAFAVDDQDAGSAGRGVHRQLPPGRRGDGRPPPTPHLGNAGHGRPPPTPHLGNAGGASTANAPPGERGMGVHRQRPTWGTRGWAMTCRAILSPTCARFQDKLRYAARLLWRLDAGVRSIAHREERANRCHPRPAV